MSKNTGLEQDWLDLYFLNSSIANVGDATGLRGSTATTWGLFVDLAKNWPGETGTVAGNVSTYTNYAAQEVARSGAGWSRSSSTIANVADIQFPTCGATGDTVKHWGTKRAIGSTVWDYYGPLAIAASELFNVDQSADVNKVRCPGRAVSLSADDEVVFVDVAGNTLPTVVTEGTIYYAGAVTADDFEVSASSPFASGMTLSDGAGRFAKVVSKVITLNDQPKIAAGALQITED